jgi:hypothetical protein
MLRRVAAFLVLSATLWLPAVTPPPAVQAASCTGWASTRVPPSIIRVLNTSTGYVSTVNFKQYVQVVTAAELWSSGYTTAMQAGVIAVKQYGWYYAMHWRGGSSHGACYDVVDNTNDQIYQPSRTATAAQLAAIDATWTATITRGGAFIATGYRSGTYGLPCGSEADGYHLMQQPSKDCSNRGLSADEILAIYYGPGVQVWRPATHPAAVILSPAEGGSGTAGASATLNWVESLASGTTITDRLVSLQMAAPRGGSCAVDRWLPASPAWQSSGAAPQTVEGLLPGYCYRAVVELTDSAGSTTYTQSGTWLVDPLAPTATFSSPANAVTAIAGSSATVRWTEAVAAGTTLKSRRLTTELAAQPEAGSCAGASWVAGGSTTAASPVAISGLTRLTCYRFRLDLTDSAGHTSSTYSGVLVTPSA